VLHHHEAKKLAMLHQVRPLLRDRMSVWNVE
jgi:hypothetical protein